MDTKQMILCPPTFCFLQIFSLYEVKSIEKLSSRLFRGREMFT